MMKTAQYPPFRADRVRTLRAFFQKVGRTRPRMANMDVLGTGEPTCGTHACILGWANIFWSQTEEYSPLLGGNPVLSSGHLIFSSRLTRKAHWREAVDRLTTMLRDNNEPLRGPHASRPKIEGFDR